VRVERLQLDLPEPTSVAVTAVHHAPTRRRGPDVLLAPGAGGDLDGAGLTALAELLASLGHHVVRVNLPHHELGQRAPRADRSVRAFQQIQTAASQALRLRHPWVVGGKSYGGRVASMAVAAGAPAVGLLLYGYPLHPPGKPQQLRVDHWPAVPVPSLFLQGDRDRFCDLGLLEAGIRRLPRRATVHVVAGGDHSLRITGAASPTGTPSSEAATIATLGDVVSRWMSSLGD
jgi:uncharacterized protein